MSDRSVFQVLREINKAPATKLEVKTEIKDSTNSGGQRIQIVDSASKQVILDEPIPSEEEIDKMLEELEKGAIEDSAAEKAAKKVAKEEDKEGKDDAVKKEKAKKELGEGEGEGEFLDDEEWEGFDEEIDTLAITMKKAGVLNKGTEMLFSRLKKVISTKSKKSSKEDDKGDEDDKDNEDDCEKSKKGGPKKLTRKDLDKELDKYDEIDLDDDDEMLLDKYRLALLKKAQNSKVKSEKKG